MIERNMNEASQAVFVYGTLRRGDSRFQVPTFIEVLHEEAYLRGFHLLHLGGFPGIIPGTKEAIVRGEVHLYENLERLDGIEGYWQADPESCLYIRQRELVEVKSSETDVVQAWTYIFNRFPRGQDREGWPDRPTARDVLAAGGKLIESGDWFKRDATRKPSQT